MADRRRSNRFCMTGRFGLKNRFGNIRANFGKDCGNGVTDSGSCLGLAKLSGSNQAPMIINLPQMVTQVPKQMQQHVFCCYSLATFF